MGTSYLVVLKFGKEITTRKYKQPTRGLCRHQITYPKCHFFASIQIKAIEDMVCEDIAIFQDIWKVTNQEQG